MKLSKKLMATLLVLLTISYGLSLATAGVSQPGCAETNP